MENEEVYETTYWDMLKKIVERFYHSAVDQGFEDVAKGVAEAVAARYSRPEIQARVMKGLPPL